MAEKPKINLQNFLIVAGPQGYGKSHLIKYIMLANRKKFSYGLVFTNTNFSVGSFDYVPKGFVYDQYNEEVLLRLMEIQKNAVERGIKKNAYLIFDDCLFGKQFKSEPFQQLMTQLRHYNIYCIISTQYPNAIPPLFRANAFQVAMFYNSTKRALTALYENYGQLFDSYDQFKKFLIKSTGNYQFLFYETQGKSVNVLERYRVMKAPEKIPKFTLKVNKTIN
jgi:hypothetical protein